MGRALRMLVSLSAVGVLIAGCTTSGGQDAAPSTSATSSATTDPDEPTTTSEAGQKDPTTSTSSTTSTTDPDSGDGPSSADLEAILPTDEDVGEPWSRVDDLEGVNDDGDDDDDENDDDESAEEEDAADDAWRDACPGASKIAEFDSDEENTDEVSATWEQRDEDDEEEESFFGADRELEVALDPTPDQFTEANADLVVEAFSDCGEITYNDPDLGGEVTIAYTVERNDDYGDFGLRMRAEVTYPFFGFPITMSMDVRYSSVDGVGVTVAATQMAMADGAPELDEPKVAELADLMRTRVQELN